MKNCLYCKNYIISNPEELSTLLKTLENNLVRYVKGSDKVNLCSTIISKKMTSSNILLFSFFLQLCHSKLQPKYTEDFKVLCTYLIYVAMNKPLIERKKDSESLNQTFLLTHSWSILQTSLLASKNICQKIGEIFLPLLRYLFR